MVQSCVFPGVSRLWKGEKCPPISQRTGATRLIRGCNERREREYSLGFRSREAIRRTFGECVAARLLSPALLTPGPVLRISWCSHKARCQRSPGLVVSWGR
jgi:hypothetical protein